MTDTAVAVRQEEPTLTPFEVIEKVVTSGDLAKMTPQERVAFYWRTCQSLGLNPLTRPFEFITLNNRLTMYARKDATDQLRKLNGVSVTSIRREKDDDLGLLTVIAGGRDKSGREDEATGVVSIRGLSGEALANAAMKAETKAKRRLTLSLVGLGFLDESEVEGATADVDPTTGEIVERPKAPTLLEAVQRQREAMAQPAEAPEPLLAEVNGGVHVPNIEQQPDASDPDALTGRAGLKAWMTAHGIPEEVALRKADELWPDHARGKGWLTDELADELLAALVIDDDLGRPDEL